MLAVIPGKLVSMACAERCGIAVEAWRSGSAAGGASYRSSPQRGNGRAGYVCLQSWFHKSSNLSRVRRARPSLTHVMFDGREWRCAVDGHLLQEQLSVRCNKGELLTSLDVGVHLQIKGSLELLPLQLAQSLFLIFGFKLQLGQLCL